jgi:SpoVK/Ycf46/Vps4 family AAA+-type ATPase
MSVVGKAKLINGWYNHSFRPVGQAGRSAKMVMDPPDRERDADAIHSPYWDKNEETVWKLPIHPVYEMFDLDEHADYRVHVNNAEPYVYDDTVDQKLILPKDVKDFLTILIEHSKNKFEDIVGGKEGGTIVLIEGVPGVGKTLTAEVYSEKMHRPLYKVQSSQLGITAEKVEEQLKEVLKRAERWGAILLIDEADVYIHERGNDIRQNAIVGVFLRVLEYYKGVLFMTTNRGTLTDDAIISRTTARFTYEMPSEDDQIRMWKVMSDQNEVGLTDADILRIVKAMPNLSGRDIKNLLKLSMVMAVNQNGRVTPDIVKFVAKFKQSGSKG